LQRLPEQGGALAMRLLVVEDDKKIASFVSRGLKEAGYVVDMAERGDDAFQLALHNHYDVAIVDLMLPGLDGLSLIERWRAQKIKMPVIILSAKRSVDDRVKGLQVGGDDYLTKPFAFSELLARIQALVRRSTAMSEPTTLTYGDLTLDLLSREVTRGGRKIELQAREFALLEYLLRNAGRVVSKTMILEHVWDYNFDPKTNVIDVLVSRLRSKVDRDFDPKLIHTMRGFGYVLKAK
jgi:heavy metal response regulator